MIDPRVYLKRENEGTPEQITMVVMGENNIEPDFTEVPTEGVFSDEQDALAYAKVLAQLHECSCTWVFDDEEEEDL